MSPSDIALSIVALAAALALVLVSRMARRVRGLEARWLPPRTGPMPPHDGTDVASPELVGARVQFLRGEVADAANALNNRMAAASSFLHEIRREDLGKGAAQSLDRAGTEITRMAAVTAGLLQRVDTFAADQDAPAPPITADAAVEPAAVLVVDDDEGNRLAISRLLQRLGHRVVTAQNGLEAWTVLDSTGADCIVCDVQMQYLGGRGLYEQVEQYNPSLASRFVFVTGDHARPATRRFLDECGCPFVTKPYEIPVLLGAISLVLSRTSRRAVVQPTP